jgi:hypothetical protein
MVSFRLNSSGEFQNEDLRFMGYCKDAGYFKLRKVENFWFWRVVAILALFEFQFGGTCYSRSRRRIRS